MMATKIEWCEDTWNPIVGCTKVSPGCANCYAERIANRLAGMARKEMEATEPGEPLSRKVRYAMCVKDGKWNGKIECIESALEIPLRWKKPRTIFVNSMSDLLHEGVPDEFIDKVFAITQIADQHTYIILTKRPGRMVEYVQRLASSPGVADPLFAAMDDLGLLPPGRFVWPIPNSILGASIEDQATADSRLPHIARLAAAGWRTMVSAEPLLGKIVFSCLSCGRASVLVSYDPQNEAGYCDVCGHIFKNMICHLVIGGETGPRARPMHPDWVRSLRDQAVAAGVPFFFKGWGAYRLAGHDEQYGPGCVCIDDSGFIDEWRDGTVCYANESDGVVMRRVGKKKAGRILDGRTWDEMPEVTR